MKNIFGKIRKNSERGQAIILVAFSIVGLVAIIGLMIDGGILLIEYARLKRGIDAASIAAASQFRKGFHRTELVKAGEEFLRLNQSDATVTISICRDPDTNVVDDATLCFDPPRKLVRITASRHVDFGFIRIVGIKGTDIQATSVGEAAAIDMVLVIDTSSSMAYDTTGTDADDPASASSPGDNPVVCNVALPGPAGNGRCEPLGQIIDVAVSFVKDKLLFYPYDQVALISTTGKLMDLGGGVKIPSRDPVLVLPFNNNYNETTSTPTTEIQDAIKRLKVFEPVVCGTSEAQVSLGGCIRFNTGIYNNIGCDNHPVAPQDQSSCGSSNFGGSLYMAGSQFTAARQESFWVTIALIGGPATATDAIPGKPTGFCPEATWLSPYAGLGRGCRDFDTVSIDNGWNSSTFVWTSATRHSADLTDPAHPVFPITYDADDYARDAADYVTSPTTGQGATLYTICLGSLCRSQDASGGYTALNRAKADPWAGDHLGAYMAEHSGGANANHGLYSYSATAAGLSDIFSDIADNIFTRISQ